VKRLDEKDISTKHLQKAGGYGNESIERKEDFQTKTSEKKNNMASKFVGNSFGQNDVDKLAEFEDKVDKNDKEQMTLLEEMRRHVKKLEDLRKHEDPRLSFSTPEFREAQRIFTDNFKKNFGKPVEWAFVKQHAWSKPQLVKLDKPVDVDGNPWPLDAQGKPILKA